MDNSKKKSKRIYSPRQRRIFSRELKKKLVEEIEFKRLKVRDVVNLYRVSTASVYKWLEIYSSLNTKGITMVVESESKETKIDRLLERIGELERTVGKKQLEIEYLNKVIDICSDELGYDVKKKEFHYAIEWYRMNKSRHNHSIDKLYEIAGFSKQAHMQYMKRRERDEKIAVLVVNSILEVRTMHSIMGLKKIHGLLSPDWIGRDRFISIGMDNGLGINKPKSYQRTTYSCKSAWFTNLTAGLMITGINQVWVSDITYYRIGDIFYYLTFIEDVYSRRILGFVAHTNLEAKANCKALEAALSERSGCDLRGLIHHSDRGSQYVSNIYLKILSTHGIGVSMCDSVYENSHIERVNGIIKSEYLNNYMIKSFPELKSNLEKAVRMYNEERPHWSLQCITPCGYEKELEKIPMNEREVMMIYSGPRKYDLQQTLFN